MYWLTEGSDISEKVVQRQLDPRYSRVIYLQKRRVIGLAYHTTDDVSNVKLKGTTSDHFYRVYIYSDIVTAQMFFKEPHFKDIL